LFRSAVKAAGVGAVRKPLPVLGTVNAYCALLAEKAGAQAIYLSGSGVATASHGLPDLGITNLYDVTEDVRRITSQCSLPLLVDIDTGFGSAFGIARCIRELQRAGAAAVHMEDQVADKRCGHRPGKQIVHKLEMIDRIKAAVDARTDESFVIMARTDALASEGMTSAIDRAVAYMNAGADMLFPEACTKLEQYKEFTTAMSADKMSDKKDRPVLANITEFGETPLYTNSQLGGVGVSLVLYPLSAHRAMAKAASTVYSAILKEGTQQSVLPLMQTRKELYSAINYHHYEQTLDRLFAKDSAAAPAPKKK